MSVPLRRPLFYIVDLQDALAIKGPMCSRDPDLTKGGTGFGNIVNLY